MQAAKGFEVAPPSSLSLKSLQEEGAISDCQDWASLDILYHFEVIGPHLYDTIVCSTPVQRSKCLRASIRSRRAREPELKVVAATPTRGQRTLCLHCLTGPLKRLFFLSRSVSFRRIYLAFARAWGLLKKDVTLCTRQSDYSKENFSYYLVLSENCLFEIETIDVDLEDLKKGLLRGCSNLTDFGTISPDEIVINCCYLCDKRRRFRVQAPCRVLLSVLVTFSSFLNQMKFGAEFPFSEDAVLTFYLGSLPGIAVKVPKAKPRLNLRERATQTLGEISGQLSSLPSKRSFRSCPRNLTRARNLVSLVDLITASFKVR